MGVIFPSWRYTDLHTNPVALLAKLFVLTTPKNPH